MGSLYRKRKMTQSVESRAWGWTRPIRSSCQLEVSLTPIILATQEAEIRRIWVQSQPPYLEKPFTKIGLMEWLKVKALSSSPSTAKEKKKKSGSIWIKEFAMFAQLNFDLLWVSGSLCLPFPCLLSKSVYRGYPALYCHCMLDMCGWQIPCCLCHRCSLWELYMKNLTWGSAAAPGPDGKAGSWISRWYHDGRRLWRPLEGKSKGNLLEGCK
jgi:hypothetical protein